jgi:hypothetical protein
VYFLTYLLALTSSYVGLRVLSIPDEKTGFLRHYGTGVDLPSNRNEYQNIPAGLLSKPDNLTAIYEPIVWKNVGTSRTQNLTTLILDLSKGS